MDASPGPAGILWTIGHSNHPLEAFLDLLTRHRIQVLVDVRSSPYSRYASQFNKEALRQPLHDRAVQYLFLGDQLGGRVDDDRFCDESGRVRYDFLSATPAFQQGIERLLGGIREYRVAILCGEEDPSECHRRLLVGRVLRERGVQVLHIRGDGDAQTEEQLAAAEIHRKTKGQLSLFDTEEPGAWRSAQSVSPRKAPPSSSASCEELESAD